MRIFKELYEPEFDRNTMKKTKDALFLTNLPFPLPANTEE
jgi:hypothetical protein